MIEMSNKNITLKNISQKELRALWRKYVPAPESGEKHYEYNEETVDMMYDRIVSRKDIEPTAGIYTKTGEIVGMLVFGRMIVSEQRCEISMILANESYRGKGYGTDALNLAKRYAKEWLGLKRMYADVSTKNVRMQAVLKKCGFQHIKTFKGNYPDGGDRMTFFAML